MFFRFYIPSLLEGSLRASLRNCQMSVLHMTLYDNADPLYLVSIEIQTYHLNIIIKLLERTYYSNLVSKKLEYLCMYVAFSSST